MNNDFQKFAVKHLGISSNVLNDYKNFQDKGLVAMNTDIGMVQDSDPFNIGNSLTPYILEEREMRMTQMDIFSRLMRDRVIWIAGAIDDSVSTVVQAQLLYLENTDADKDVTLHLDTPGGSVKSGLSIVDMMDYVNYDIATINTGMCASMGSVLLGAGTKGKRSSLRFSKTMTHQVSHGTQGNVQDTRINQREAEKYNYVLFRLLAEYSDKDWKEVMELSGRDNWMTAEETKELGLIDEIIIKEGERSITQLMEGYDEYRKYVD